MALKINNFQNKHSIPELEHKVLDFWESNQTFKKSVDNRDPKKSYVFFDGPPFATGLPHYGHILSSTTKDVIPRYWTMKGYRVERVWGWDCHGIPIENIVEKELGLKGGKKAIEEMGIDKFNSACRSAILRFDQEWEKTVTRMGRWVDFKNSYKTMDTSYMESVWWAFKALYQKNLVYEGKKVILYCPRCSTPLSNFEIAMDNSYQEINDLSTIYKYKVINQKNTYLLAWSTTPWNKLATPALAVNPNFTYVKIKQGEEKYILAENTLKILGPKASFKVLEKIKGSVLENIQFEEHFKFFKAKKNERHGVIVADEYVTDDEGTGIVTLAIYGEDDYRVMKKNHIQLIEHIDEQGKLKPQVKPFAGMFILKVDPLVNQDLEKRGLIYRNDPYTHRVPVCYRCSTRLYYAPIPAWFINVQKLKPKLIKANQSINWHPDYLKHGRFGTGLKDAPDWNISRSRYWGTPMPIWIGEKTQKIRVIGSIEELKKWAVDKKFNDLTDIHREHIDSIKIWVDDAKTEVGVRVKEVFDCWVESGSMSFAAIHYPFENKQKFESNYPAQFISEYIAQTRAWFYTLHVISVALFDKPAFENVLTTGTIMAHDGTKMSKSKRNFPDPNILIEKYGVDSLRFYLMSSSVMKAGNPNFSEDSVKEIHQKLISILWNVFSFYKMYVPNNNHPTNELSEDILDRWLVSLTNSLVKNVTNYLDDYNTVKACLSIQTYVTDLSTWYLRRSRNRLKENLKSQTTFTWALETLTKVMAPITPFISEAIYHNLNNHNQNSVHLTDWPKMNKNLIDQTLEKDMIKAREIVEKIHSIRKEKEIKVRQPLAKVTIFSKSFDKHIHQIILDETNIKEIIFKGTSEKLEVKLDTKLTPELIKEGEARDLIRQIQNLRKEAEVDLDQKVKLFVPSWPKEFEAEIKKKTFVSQIVKSNTLRIE